MNIFIGGAWPYANGSLHIGHLSSLLGGDILARYFRLKGDQVLYVSGSDCHGTPITLRAKKEGVSPETISSRYHEEFSDCFKRLGFSYDSYGRTDSEEHKAFVSEFITALYEKGQLYESSIDQAFCPVCSQFLPDRFVTGLCPHCGKPAKGDQCDHCGSLLDPNQLLERKCGVCGAEPEFRATTHLFLPLSQYEEQIRDRLSHARGWRANAIGMTQRYLDEGLRDRAVTRDIEWGIPVPIKGYEDKKIYVWVEAVLGYLSGAKTAALEQNKSFEAFWHQDAEAKHYYVHGKDNIPFHTVILPALLLSRGEQKLPDSIISSEYETLEGKKISTSNNWAVWVPDLISRYDPDTIRFFFIANGPERKDSDFSWQEFIQTHNTELVNQFGNLVNRTLVFLKKSYDLTVPEGTIEPEVGRFIAETYETCGKAIEQGAFREALECVTGLVKLGNRYFDEQKPWVTVKESKDQCSQTLFNLIQLLCNLSVLLEPFIPFAAAKLRKLLNASELLNISTEASHVASDESAHWTPHYILSGHTLFEPSILFERLDKKLVEQELERLKAAIQG
ncbi:MAG: methionine--tRNA ligase [Clostridia bacterium]|nr:methionine--tRNA ligase [Clostridia bacterium]